MAAPKRTAFQIERDRRDIADMYLQGWTQARITEHLNARKGIDYQLSTRMIGYDLKSVQEAWRASALIDIDEAKARELAKVDRLEREYWDAWGRSCEDAETTRQEGDETGPSKVVKTSKGQAGDPRFLAGVQWCIERRCKIIGVDAPTRQEHTGRGGGPMETVGMSLAEWTAARTRRRADVEDTLELFSSDDE